MTNTSLYWNMYRQVGFGSYFCNVTFRQHTDRAYMVYIFIYTITFTVVKEEDLSLKNIQSF
jgi:hypothetical protein